MCGVQDRAVAFLLTDSQIVNEAFLEDISYILNSGEIPGKLHALLTMQQHLPEFGCHNQQHIRKENISVTGLYTATSIAATARVTADMPTR